MTQSIGEQLKEARLARKLTIKKVTQAIAIRAHYLEAMEADDFESLPSPVQARGFLRLYANFLGLDADRLVATLRGETTVATQENTLADAVIPTPPVPEMTADTQKPSEEDTSSIGQTPDAQAEPDSAPPIKESLIFPSLPYLPYDDEEQNQGFGEPIRESLLPLSKSIMLEIGQQIKNRRELLSLTLDEVERHTHIRRRHLEALENGAFEDLPSPVQARGMLTSYARFLDMDVEALLLRFADTLQAWRDERYPRSPRQKPSPTGQNSGFRFWLQRLLSTDLVFGGGLIVAMVIFAIWGAGRIIVLQQQKQADAGNSQSISEALLDTTPFEAQATVAITPTINSAVATIVGAASTPTPFDVPTLQSSAPVQVIVVISQKTWLRAIVDNRVKFEGRAQAGSALTFEGDRRVEILAADGGAVQIIYNQRRLGTMSNPGQVANLIYTQDEILEPTPTITPTPTRTPRTTPTRTPTRTPTPSEITLPSG